MGTGQRKTARRRKKKGERNRRSICRAKGLLGDGHPVHACMVNRDWREGGIASIYLARQVSAGRVTIASFFVDRYAMGLKDAWGRTAVPHREFDEQMADLQSRLDLQPLNLGLAKHLVYGGIELAGELGFRLPQRYERWTAVLGPLPEGESPDMTLFRLDGKIRLVCSTRDFEARLIGSTPESFLARPDVDFILSNDDFTSVDEEAEEFNNGIAMLEEAMLNRVKAWCFSNGQAPYSC